MLDSETKRRIDSARDILVGKVPDPKSQVEQITIALIYKFMDDMDKESVEMGGKAKFFSGKFKTYSWSNIFDPKLSGIELVNLYGEAITQMNQNPNIPDLFRDIFKNAYLPYRDPETLKSFLKEISWFEYSHSEKLGDAYEYLLSILGSQGEAGQFRTPRHIIDFMVEMVDPKKNDVILDPACGTAGFLISAYRYILKNNSTNFDSAKDPRAFELHGVKLSEITINGKKYKGDKLTSDEKARLSKNIIGYDISPDMVRLSLVNMYLHGFTSPKIQEYDTLTSEDKWDERADAIMANPPFMSPKGGIKPNKRFSVESNRSEVLFVDYIAEHLRPQGRAAVIVPEGIIFQSQTAYKNLRKMLIEKNFLVGVISLPAGMFNPYSGVKTSILWIDKALAKKTDKIFFAKIENDGFDLGAQRRPIDKNDLPATFQAIQEYKKALGMDKQFQGANWPNILMIDKSKIAESEDFNLISERYRIIASRNNKWPMIKLGELCEVKTGKKDVNEGNPNGIYPFFTCAEEHTYSDTYSFDVEALLIAGNGDVGAIKYYKGKFEAYQRTYILSAFKNVDARYLYFILKTGLKETVSKQRLGNTMPYIKLGMLTDFETPLPPLEIQKEIVAEIEGYQKIVDAARKITEAWKPQIDIDPNWKEVKLKDVCEKITDGTHQTPTYSQTGFVFLSSKNVTSGKIDWENVKYIPKDLHEQLSKRVAPKLGDVLLAKSGTTGVAAVVDKDIEFDIYESLALFRPSKSLNSLFLLHLLNSAYVARQFDQRIKGVGIRHLHLNELSQIDIPLPSLDTQKQIVAMVEAESALVDSAKKLLEINERKIKKCIDKVWGVK